MSRPEQVAERFDREASTFDAIYSGRKGWVGRTWDRFTRENVRWRFTFTLDAVGPLEGRRVLDVGCGSGRYTVAMAQRGAREAVGIDLAPSMLDLARRHAADGGVERQCTFLQQDLFKYAPDAPFDIVLAIGLFDYLPASSLAMRRLGGLTREMFVAAFPARWALRAPVRKAWRGLQRCAVRFYSRAEIIAHCDAAGLRVVRLVRHGPIYMLVGEPAASPMVDVPP